MARKRRRKRKRNPTPAQWAVLGVGGAVGLGLIGYGVYMWRKDKQEQLPAGPEGAFIPTQDIWTFEVTTRPSGFRGGPSMFSVATIYPPTGDLVTLAPVPAPALATQQAVQYIRQRGGIPQQLG